MLITCHLLTGAAIASTPALPEVSLPAAFLSHFVLDMAPHLETTTFSNRKKGEDYYPTKKEVFYVILDVLVGLFILTILYLKLKEPLIIYGALLAVLPDLIVNIPLWYRLRRLPVLKWFYQFHEKIHFDLKAKIWYLGIPLQALVLGVALWYFFIVH